MKYIFSIFFVISISTCFASTHFNKVVFVIFENTNYSKAIAQPNFANFAKKGLLLSNIFAETHPSQGNYIALISGSTFDVINDKNVDLDGIHIGDLLENKGLTWRVYAENFPGNCFSGAISGKYVRKHVPFLSFVNISQDKNRCKNIEDETRFEEDFKNNNLANFNLYIPNIQNDGHDSGVDFAGKWLESKFGQILSNPQSLGETLFVITFDESGVSPKNQIYTSIIGKNVAEGTEDCSNLNHYSLLKLIESEFGLKGLGKNDTNANSINIKWK